MIAISKKKRTSQIWMSINSLSPWFQRINNMCLIAGGIDFIYHAFKPTVLSSSLQDHLSVILSKGVDMVSGSGS